MKCMNAREQPLRPQRTYILYDVQEAQVLRSQGCEIAAIKKRVHKDPFISITNYTLDVEGNIGFSSKFEEHCCTTKLDTIDKIVRIKIEQVNGHLACDKSNFSLLAKLA